MKSDKWFQKGMVNSKYFKSFDSSTFVETDYYVSFEN